MVEFHHWSAQGAASGARRQRTRVLKGTRAEQRAHAGARAVVDGRQARRGYHVGRVGRARQVVHGRVVLLLVLVHVVEGVLVVGGERGGRRAQARVLLVVHQVVAHVGAHVLRVVGVRARQLVRLLAERVRVRMLVLMLVLVQLLVVAEVRVMVRGQVLLLLLRQLPMVRAVVVRVLVLVLVSLVSLVSVGVD